MAFNVLFIPRPADELTAVIRLADADVVVTEELTAPLAADLEPRLADRYPYRRLGPTRDGHGLGVWSRTPITETPGVAGLERVRALPVDVAFGGGTVHVVAVHLTLPDFSVRHWSRLPIPIVTGVGTERRRAETADLAGVLRDLGRDGRPVIAAGDFNLTDQTPEYRHLLGAGLIDAHREAGSGFGMSFPARPMVRAFGRSIPPFPVVRIDYIFHSPDLAAQRMEVWPASGGSDHYPVVADLRLREATARTRRAGSLD